MNKAAELVAITHEPTVATMFATALVTRLFWLTIVCPTVLMGHGRVAAATVAAQHSTAQHSTAQHSTAQDSSATNSDWIHHCTLVDHPLKFVQRLHAGYSLVLALVDELLKGFLECIAKLLILLEGLSEDSVQLYLHLQQS